MTTVDNLQHFLCPKGKECSCKFIKAQVANIIYKNKHSLTEAVMVAVKPIYIDLTHELLKLCLHGKTQNQSESFNSCIWDRI